MTTPDPAAIAAMLGPKQRQAIVVLGRIERTWGMPATPREVADVLADLRVNVGRRRATAEAEAMASTLRSLERRGLAERKGAASNGARAWALTGLGRQVREAL
ncbi:MAG TPA: hypothetical protein VGW74_08010 [Propionibacteriaceae bacterium]|nr:hypothetical protein [Propionibacteriaceae bacterium]